MTPAYIGAKLLGIFLPVDTARKLAPLGFAAAIIVGLFTLYGAFQVWDYFDDKAAVNADRAKANAETLATVAEGDEAAQGAAMGVSDDVEAGNTAALEAAEGSDDPLADALNEL